MADGARRAPGGLGGAGLARLWRARGGAPAGGADGARRAPGELAGAVLTVLWRSGRALTAGEVRDALAGPDAGGALSYSTVVTILSRLHDKGVLARQRDEGRAFRYRPVTDEPGL